MRSAASTPKTPSLRCSSHGAQCSIRHQPSSTDQIARLCITLLSDTKV